MDQCQQTKIRDIISYSGLRNFNVTIHPRKILNHYFRNVFLKMNLIKQIVNILHLPSETISKPIALSKDDNTIPFIARYRKEVAGNLDEVQILASKIELQRLENLETRWASILKSVQGSGKLTKELQEQILTAETITLLEDFYQPYRPKRHTQATIAKEKGRESLAQEIIKQPNTKHSVSEYQAPFLNKNVKNN